MCSQSKGASHERSEALVLDDETDSRMAARHLPCTKIYSAAQQWITRTRSKHGGPPACYGVAKKQVHMTCAQRISKKTYLAFLFCLAEAAPLGSVADFSGLYNLSLL